MARDRGGPTGSAERLDELARRPSQSLYLLHGDETWLVERALTTLRRRCEPEGAWQVVWGDDEAERVRGALDTLGVRSLFGGTPTVVVRRVEGMRGAVESAVEAAVADERRDGRLVLVGGAVDRRKRWYATARTRAHEVACAPLADEREARGWVDRLAAERGVRLAGDAVAALLERCGFDLGLLDGEIERVALRAGREPIGRDAILDVVTRARGHAVEELTDRLARGDATGALRVLRSLLDDDEPPLRVLGFLAANVRRALHVAEAQERGASLAEIAATLGMPEWLVRRQLGRGTAVHLERALDVLLDLDLALKRSRPEEIVFEAALGRLVAPRLDRARDDRRRG